MFKRAASRPKALTFAAVSAATLALSSYTLFDRIQSFNADNPKPVFLMQAAAGLSYTYAGRPVSLEPEIDDAGEGTITLRYGDESQVIPVAIPNSLDLPGETRFEDWLRVLRFVEAEAGADPAEVARRVEFGEADERLVVVTRTPTPEDNEGMLGIQLPEGDWGYGEVLRRRWVFDFYELTKQGTIERETLLFPTTKYYEQHIEGELKQGTWQYDAAFRVMPTGSTPKHNFTEAALVEAGWPLGVSGASILILIGSMLVLLAPDRVQSVPGEPASDEKRAEAERLLKERRGKKS